jgi:hypothetical protein
MYNDNHRFWEGKLAWVYQKSAAKMWPVSFRNAIIDALERAPFFGGNVGPLLGTGGWLSTSTQLRRVVHSFQSTFPLRCAHIPEV